MAYLHNQLKHLLCCLYGCLPYAAMYVCTSNNVRNCNELSCVLIFSSCFLFPQLQVACLKTSSVHRMSSASMVSQTQRVVYDHHTSLYCTSSTPRSSEAFLDIFNHSGIYR